MKKHQGLVDILRKEVKASPHLEADQLLAIHKKLFRLLARHYDQIVAYCQRKMLKEIYSFSLDYEKLKIKLKELDQRSSLVTFVGQYMPREESVEGDMELMGKLNKQ